MYDTSLVIPVYNEADVLQDSVKRVMEYMNNLSYSYEIIIAEDGSSDGSEEIAFNLSSRYDGVRVSHSDERLGRGEALKKAFKISKGEVLIYFDADLSTDLKGIEKAIEKIKGSCDVCVGSRVLPKSDIKRNLKREIASKGYNILARILFNSKVTDLQCGFKAFKRSMILLLLKTENDHWFWDTEVLLRAEVKNKKICQIPVRWVESKDTKVNVLKSVIGMGSRLIKLRIKLL